MSDQFETILIRPYEPTDAAPIATILNTCIDEGGSMAVWEHYTDEDVATYERNPYRGTYVAVAEKQVIGYVSLTIRGGTYEHTGIVSIGILPDYRGQGLGRRLMRSILWYGFDVASLERIELEVFAMNERAIGLYRSMGFVEEGRRRNGHNERGAYVDVVGMGMLRSEWVSPSKPTNNVA